MVLHRGGFVVVGRVIVAADEKVIDLVGLVQTCGGADAVFKKRVDLTTADFFRTAENEADVAVGNFLGVGIEVAARTMRKSGGGAEIPHFYREFAEPFDRSLAAAAQPGLSSRRRLRMKAGFIQD